MKTTLLRSQHERCLAALEMIQNCDIYIHNCRENLRRHNATHFINQMPCVQEFNEKGINNYKKIKERLILYYSNQFMKMIEPVAEAMN